MNIPMKFLLTILLVFSMNCFGSILLYEVEDKEGKKHFIFGTFHTDDNRVTNLDPITIQSIQQASLFLMETEELNDVSILHLTDFDAFDYLDEKKQDEFKSLCDFHVMNCDSVRKMKPWLTAFIFDSPKPITPFNQDNLLKRQAENFGIKVKGIETLDEHFSALDSLNINEQVNILINTLARSEEEKENNFEQIMKVYLLGDLEQIRLVDQQVSSGLMNKNVWQKVKQKLLIERNDLFNERIKSFMRNERLFIAIGASHLSGENGLLNFLKKMEFKVDRVE